MVILSLVRGISEISEIGLAVDGISRQEMGNRSVVFCGKTVKGYEWVCLCFLAFAGYGLFYGQRPGSMGKELLGNYNVFAFSLRDTGDIFDTRRVLGKAATLILPIIMLTVMPKMMKKRGESIFMRVLATILKPTKGVLLLNEVPYVEANYEKIQKKIGYLPKELNLYPNLTVGDC